MAARARKKPLGRPPSPFSRFSRRRQPCRLIARGLGAEVPAFAGNALGGTTLSERAKGVAAGEKPPPPSLRLGTCHPLPPILNACKGACGRRRKNRTSSNASLWSAPRRTATWSRLSRCEKTADWQSTRQERAAGNIGPRRPIRRCSTNNCFGCWFAPRTTPPWRRPAGR